MMEAVPVGLLERLAALRPSDPPRAAQRRARRDDFDVRAWLAEHGVAIVREKPWLQGAVVLELEACVFPDAHEHHRGEAAVILLASGMLLYKCQHATCVGREWPQVREHFDGPPHVRDRRQDGRPPLGPDSADAVRLTDVGNARRLIAAHGENLRYCAPWKKWLVWDGQRWARDDRQRVREYAKAVTSAMLREAADLPAGDVQKALAEHALRSQKADRLRGMLELAQSDPAVAMVPADFDADPWLLNVINGTIDLRTGRLREHRRADLITKRAPVNFDPAARSELWERFLTETMRGNADLVAFLQRCVGYSLTGTTGEEVLFFLHGPEATGKSTFAEAIKATLGDYARTADFETFLQKKGDRGIPNDIAALAGARLVVSIEMADGKRLAEGLVKQLTGGDTVSARFLFGEYFDFTPQFKLWLAANDAPRVRHSDRAIWRRILRIPFEHTVSPTKRDPTVKATFKNPALGGPAILAWAVEGCLGWQRDRLNVPAEVAAATASYREAQDPLRDFFAECCVFDPQAWTASKELYDTYRGWAEANGFSDPMTNAAFGKQLSEHGCTRGKDKNDVRGWWGIGLQPGAVDAFRPLQTGPSGELFSNARTKGTYPERPVGTGLRGNTKPRCPRCGGPEWTPPLDGDRAGHCASCGAVPVLDREPGEDDGDEEDILDAEGEE